MAPKIKIVGNPRNKNDPVGGQGQICFFFVFVSEIFHIIGSFSTASKVSDSGIKYKYCYWTKCAKVGFSVRFVASPSGNLCPVEGGPPFFWAHIGVSISDG